MKAVRLHSYHEFPTVDDVPDPQVTGHHDVVVRIGGAGLCRTDLHVYEGQWAEETGIELPYIIGHENAGWVEAVGDAVTTVAPGDAVICHPLISCGLCRACRAGDDMHCAQSRFPGLDSDGGWAEYLKTAERACVKLDPGLEPADVAAHADAGVTAYHAVKKTVPLLYPGTRAVVIGAGGLGHIGIQCLKALTPARVIVVDKSEEALSLARDWGADETVQADGGQVDQVLEVTDGKGAEVVLDFVGEAGAEKDGVAMTREAGSYFVIGYGGRLDVPTMKMITTEIGIVGNLVGTYNDLAELMSLAAQGTVLLHTQPYPLDAAVDAMRDLDAGRLHGRGILVPRGA
ncbi:MAG TPA: NAD(P)-dependent alcohol dehydrogenase [Egibacteraceae bacterium]|nr:NAD(P)-dependent alcohol dehydrogenase [Egibacteraceae bacterium]